MFTKLHENTQPSYYVTRYFTLFTIWNDVAKTPRDDYVIVIEDLIKKMPRVTICFLASPLKFCVA